MIDGIRRTDYAYHMPENYSKKINQSNEVLFDTPVYNKSEHEALWKTYQYAEEKEEAQIETEWDQYKKMLTADEKNVANLYQQGYQVDTFTMKEMAYVESQMPKKEKRSISQAQYEPIEKKVDRIREHQDSMYRYAMEQGTLSINELYRASYTGSNQKGIHQYVKEDVTKVLTYNNLQPTEGNTWAASKLMSLGMDVTKDSVVKMQNTYAAIESLDKQEESQKALEDLEEGKEPGNRPILEEEKILYTEKDIQEIIDDLTKVEDGHIETVLDEKRDMTIGNLRESMLKNTEQVLKGSKGKRQVKEATDQPVVADKTVDGIEKKEDKVSVVKEQIREIRAMLNTESARKLSEKMPLESTELAKVAEELRGIQEETIEDAAKKVDLALNEDTKVQIKQVMEAAIMIGRYKEQAIGAIEQGEATEANKGQVTVEAIHEALVAYEEAGTIPEKRFGETIHKLKDEIQAFLERNQLPQDQLTTEASKALIANGMDLTVENLEGVKEALLKINVLLEDLTPYQAAALIKEGVNPYKASVNNLVEWLGTKQMPKLQDTVAGAIVTLEDKGKINEEQKQSLIGLYRILNSVKNNKEQVVGYLYKNQMPATIEKLEEAIKYGAKAQTINKQIDDTFGELEKLDYTHQTARDKIYEAKEAIDEVIDAAKLLEQMELPITKENMDKMTHLKTMLYPLIKATVKEALGKFEGLDVLPESVKEKIESLKEVKPEVVELMEKYRMPVTLSNLYWVQKLYDHPELYKEMLEREQFVEKDFPESFKEIEEDLKNIEKEVVAQKEQCMQQGDMLGYKNYKQLEEMVGIQKQLNEKEGFYQIPFVIHGETKLVNLYIHEKATKKDRKKEGIEAVISYDTKKLGNIKAYLNLKEDSISYKVVGENANATRMLEKEEKALKKVLDSLGYAIGKAVYDTEQDKEAKPMAVTLKGDSQFEMIV